MTNNNLCLSRNPLPPCKIFLKIVQRKPTLIWKDELEIWQLKQKILLNLVFLTLKSTAGSESVVIHSDFKGLKKVAEEIDSIREEVMKIKNNTSCKDVQLSETSLVATSSSRLSAPINKDPMVGFDAHLLKIKALLKSDSKSLEVIPIFGMGGIGKTTLARNVYNDPVIEEYFHFRAWITVSQDYSAREILSSLLAFMQIKISDEQSNQLMGLKVYQHLMGRRYLIIMDDMWSTKAWDDVSTIFPDDRNGSRIMLTTRLYHVAAYPNYSTRLHEMNFMDVDQSWNLLQQKVFPQENCPLELETIGKTIARSCGGLPLAIVLIAGLLSTVSRTQAAWENIAKNIKLAISNINDERFTKILSLSYTYLPHHLRPCFLYMGGYPEDHEIRASKLVKLWVAEGFSKQSGSKSFEEAAEEYLEDHVKRSLILVTRRQTNDQIKSCSVHDLVRDLCIRKAQEEMFHLNVRYAGKIYPESIKSQRRVSIAHSDMHRLETISGSTIRTIICFGHDGSSLSSFGNSRLLRVLDERGLTSGIVTVLPKEVFELFHLRYVAFTSTTPEQFVLPPSILNLQNLQTLIIDDAVEFCLPMQIWRLRQLRHLKIRGPLPNIPQGAATFPLENLQTLSGVKNFKCTEEILKMIPNLKTLGIYYPEGSGEYAKRGYESVKEYHLNNLVNLHRLEKLTMDSNIPAHLGREYFNPVFPSTLKKLTMLGQLIRWQDMGIVGSLPNLQVLKLKGYQSGDQIWQTREGEFSQLKYLQIDSSSFYYWITKNSHFPRLKRLVFLNCGYLQMIPDDIGKIPTLELILIGWNKSLNDSIKKLHEKQVEVVGRAAAFKFRVARPEEWS